MDEYKEYLYSRSSTRYARIDPGDLTDQLAIREKLQCKPFKWFMENVAFDLPKKYPYIDPEPVHSGAIKSMSSNLCIDTLGRDEGGDIGLYSCSNDLKKPSGRQSWIFSWQHEIRTATDDICWDAPHSSAKSSITLYGCHSGGGNQYFDYDVKNNLLKFRYDMCLDHDKESKKVFLNKCDKNNPNMKWQFGSLIK